MEELWDQYRRNSKGWREDNLVRVHPKIYLGSARNVDILTFSSLNISHVINCADKQPDTKWFEREYPERFALINAVDSEEKVDITFWYPEFHYYMDKFLNEPECTGVYVHCQCGINRSCFLLLCYMCKKFGYPIENTIKCIASQRPCAFQNKSFRSQVVEFLKKTE